MTFWMSIRGSERYIKYIYKPISQHITSNQVSLNTYIPNYITQPTQPAIFCPREANCANSIQMSKIVREEEPPSPFTKVLYFIPPRHRNCCCEGGWVRGQGCGFLGGRESLAAGGLGQGCEVSVRLKEPWKSWEVEFLGFLFVLFL